MSIAILIDTYHETRRLAVAGAAVASGDFRLKKLVPALAKAGEKAPVFAKIAQAAQAVVESTDKTASAALLELASLISAVLYTQGETGAPGELKPVESINFQAAPTQASARMLMPLLEALRTTGSGRYEIIKEAVERGAFHDLRLVLPAIGALDDVYSEIADLIQDKVLPLYGAAVIPELETRLDVKRGKAGDVRRLKLLQRLAPAAAKPHIKQALETGSKEIRVAAIECLGESAEDLTFLLDQAKAKAKDVRIAALTSLTKLDVPAAIEAVKQAAFKADLTELRAPLQVAKSAELQQFVIVEAEKQLAATLQQKDEKARGKAIEKLQDWLGCLETRHDAAATRLIAHCFEQAAVLAKLKSQPSGNDLNEFVTFLMYRGAPVLRERLIAAGESLTGPSLEFAVSAARCDLSPPQFYAMFAAQLVTDKKSGGAKKRATATPSPKDRQTAIRSALLITPNSINMTLAGTTLGYPVYISHGELPPLDARWLDIAVELEDVDLVCELIRPGHAAANQFLSAQFANKKKAEPYHMIRAMIRGEHPELVTHFLSLLKGAEKASTASSYGYYWLARFVPDLPISAIEPLEALLPTLGDKLIDQFLGPLQALKAKQPVT